MKNLLAGILCFLTLVGCKHQEYYNDSDIKALISSDPSFEQIKQQLDKDFFVIVNIQTNRLTVIKNGMAISQWNIATGDVSGGNHEGIAKYTPTGLFTINQFINCPHWYPSDVKDENGQTPDTWEGKMQIYNKYPEIYGPCGTQNPLGESFMWFYGEYGLHGNSDSSVLRRRNPADRAVSGGCIRNPNKLVNRLMTSITKHYKRYSPKFDKFLKDIKADRKKTRSDRQEIILDVTELEIPILIGQWDRDIRKGSKVR